MVCYAEQVVVNHGLLFWDSGCESWFIMLSQWFLIMDCYVVPKVVNFVVLYCASGCES
jgi:hypothetical protein